MLNDLLGQKFGRLEVLGRSSFRHPKGKVFWDCKCMCGNVCSVVSWNLTSGETKSCGCLNKESVGRASSLRGADLVGREFGSLLVTRKFKNNKSNVMVWECRCVCGSIINATTTELNKGTKKSCGCRGLSFGETSQKLVYKQYITGAKKRGLDFSLTMEQFLELSQGNCVYCGKPPSNTRKSTSSRGDFIYNGVDRVNNNLGYIDGNCVACCKVCNNAKNKYSLDEFLSWVNLVFLHSIQTRREV